MSLDFWMIAILGLLNAFQFVFWSYQNQTLVNKLMCRNFAEYELVKHPPMSKPVISEEDLDVIAEQQLNELNSRFGS